MTAHPSHQVIWSGSHLGTGLAYRPNWRLSLGRFDCKDGLAAGLSQGKTCRNAALMRHERVRVVVASSNSSVGSFRRKHLPCHSVGPFCTLTSRNTRHQPLKRDKHRKQRRKKSRGHSPLGRSTNWRCLFADRGCGRRRRRRRASRLRMYPWTDRVADSVIAHDSREGRNRISRRRCRGVSHPREESHSRGADWPRLRPERVHAATCHCLSSPRCRLSRPKGVRRAGARLQSCADLPMDQNAGGDFASEVGVRRVVQFAVKAALMLP